ncbi:unnamed protein product [Closterium sp. Naga37s-1]|nr:unnamed protein product [Closterium sp. Naga37s-1]
MLLLPLMSARGPRAASAAATTVKDTRLGVTTTRSAPTGDENPGFGLERPLVRTVRDAAGRGTASSGEMVRGPESIGSPRRTEWEDCSHEPAVEVRDVFMAPDPPVIGHPFELQLPAVARQMISGGEVAVTIKFHGLPVHVEYTDICQQTACPVLPGSFTFQYWRNVPSLAFPRSGRRGVSSSSNAMASSSLCAPSLGPHVWHAEPTKQQQQQQQQQPRLLPPCLHEEVAESDDPCDSIVPAHVTCATVANAVNAGTAPSAANAASVDYSQQSVVDYSQHATFFAQERRENPESRVESWSQPLESFCFRGDGGGCGGSVLYGVDCGPVDHLFPAHVSAAAEGPFRGFSGAAGGDLGLCALPPAVSWGIGAEHVQEVTPLAVLETIRALPGLAGGPSVPHRPMSRGAKAAVARVMMRRRAAEQQQQKRLQQEEEHQGSARPAGSDGEVAVKTGEMVCPRGPFAVFKHSLETPLIGSWEEARGVAEDAGKMEVEVVEEGRQGPDAGLFEGGAAVGRELAAMSAMAAVAVAKSAGESPQSAGTKRARELGIAEAVPPVSKAARGLWEVVACRERALADAADAIDPADVVNNVIDPIDAIGSIGVIGSMDLVQVAAGAGAVEAQAEAAASGVLGAGGMEEELRGELEWFAGAEIGGCMGSLFGGKADGLVGICVGQCLCCGGVKTTTTWTGCHAFTMAGVAGLPNELQPSQLLGPPTQAEDLPLHSSFLPTSLPAPGYHWDTDPPPTLPYSRPCAISPYARGGSQATLTDAHPPTQRVMWTAVPCSRSRDEF